MGELLRGRLQSGKGAASHWLQLFNAAYSRKLQTPVYPGSLNLALEHTFDWFAVRYQTHIIWFGREEYGGERDVLLLPCKLADFERRKAFLWTPTTAARSRPDPWVVELVCDIGLRDTYRLQDGDVLAVELPVQEKPTAGRRDASI
jgi:Transcriptional regulator of a riboflavin/FAD biosynthetic operon